MGFGKPQLHAKCEVAGFMSYGYTRESVFKRQIRFWPPFGRVRGNVRTSTRASWKVDFLFAITERFSLALTADALIRRNRLC